ncbi:uncharacterized protein LOC121837712 [Ixodes scapularis]|uniref:uncharacterized protein LOC121837712 n=1 Tax=Ixodes scapularis TaxID=6945 RepID=UPI001C383E62|nr:uncharacterized protein LOC121837712 [Ixodes scapularis]
MATNVGMKEIRRGFCSDCSCKELYQDPCTVERTTLSAELTAATRTRPTTNSLKVDAQLRFHNTIVAMLGKLEEVKGAFCGDNPTTFLNVKTILRSRLARSSLITYGRFYP